MHASYAQAFVNVEFRFQPIEMGKIVHNPHPLLQLLERRSINIFKKFRLANEENMQQFFCSCFHIREKAYFL